MFGLLQDMRIRVLAALVGSVLAVTPAWAATHLISGQVLDRNGRPMVRAIVSLTPAPEGCPEGGGCTVELVTDRDGRFVIDYLRDKTGERIKLAKKTEYTLEVFKAGYHTFTSAVPYRRGELPIEPVTMVEETIDVQDFPENLDPQLYTKATQSSGASYEGQ
jgi:hypothetical protein